MKITLGKGWDELQKALTEIQDIDMTEVMQAAAEVVLERALELVPVDTGELRDSLHIERDGQDVLVVASAPYAEPVEFGTSNMAAQPYLRPAYDDTTALLEAEAQVLFGKVESAWDG